MEALSLIDLTTMLKNFDIQEHCERIGVDPETYCYLISQRYDTYDEYLRHIYELQQIVQTEAYD